MKKLVLSFVLLLSVANLQAQSISHIETTKSWYYIYDQDGKKIKTLSTSQGELKGYSSTFYIIKQGSAFYVTYDVQGKWLHTFGAATVGEILAVSGDTFTSRQGVWIYTWSKEGKKISTRAAKKHIVYLMNQNKYFENYYKGLNPTDYIDIPDRIRDLLWEAYNDNGVVVNTNKLYEAYQLCNSVYNILREHEYQIEADNAEMNGENGFSLLYGINDDEYHAIQSMYEICEIYHKYFKFFDTSQIKSNKAETIEQEEAIQESESFNYIIDNDPEHDNWHISVLESKLKQGKDKLMVLYVCINELYNNLCQLEKIGIDTDKDLFIYRFTGLVKQGASFLPSEKIKWYEKNVLLGHIIRCLTSDNKYYPEKMEIAAEFFEAKTGKNKFGFRKAR